MNKLTSFMRSISKRTYALTALAIATVAVPASLFAWGPANRVTFTLAKPADYVTFNSITDNKQYGDERNFVQIRNLTDNAQFGENTSLVPGKEYEVFVYFHNNASSSLNDAAHNYVGVAKGAFMRAQMPASVAAGQDARVTAFVGATNAKHLDKNGTNLGNQVWDDAFGKNSTNSAVALRYVSGSAKITSNGAVNGKTLPDTLFTSGTAIGYNALDGNLPGCLPYSGYVTYRFKVDQPNFEVQKTVSPGGQSHYSKTVSAKSGDTVDFKIQYKNTGTTQQDGVVIRDQLPAGLNYVAGSTFVATSATNGQWTKISQDTIVQQGINLGSYAPNGNAYVKFSAKISSEDKLACGMNTIKNIASADTQNGSKSDSAVVTVNKECKPPVTVKACNLDTMKIEQVDASKVDNVHFTTNLALCTVVPGKVNACNLDTKTVESVDQSKIDNVHYTRDLSKCEVTPTTPTTPETPGELPHTGIADGFMGVLGLGSVAAATSYYRASRRAMQN